MNSVTPVKGWSWELLSATMVVGGPRSVVGIATGYGLDGLGIESWWERDFLHLSRLYQGVKSSQGVSLTPHPLLLPWSWKGRAIPLLPLWAVRPVQSLSACTRVTFTFTVVVEAVLLFGFLEWNVLYIMKCLLIKGVQNFWFWQHYFQSWPSTLLWYHALLQCSRHLAAFWRITLKQLQTCMLKIRKYSPPKCQ